MLYDYDDGSTYQPPSTKFDLTEEEGVWHHQIWPEPTYFPNGSPAYEVNKVARNLQDHKRDEGDAQEGVVKAVRRVQNARSEAAKQRAAGKKAPKSQRVTK